MTSADANPVLRTSQTRRKPSSFYGDDEDIVVKPSTELIPDEYVHSAEDMPVIHIFHDERYNGEEVQMLVDSFREIGYKITPENNLHLLEDPNDLKNDLHKIYDNLATAKGLILLVMGFYEDNNDTAYLLFDEKRNKQRVYMKDIWRLFTSDNCKDLQSKPKIFIFCASKYVSGVQVDSVRHHTTSFNKVYDFPAESDILIVYKKNTDVVLNPIEDFLQSLCNNVKSYSKRHDIIDIITSIPPDNMKTPPLIISTLTRKFYLTCSNQRENYLALLENNGKLEQKLNKIHAGIQKLHDHQRKKKEKKFTFPSFRRKTEEKPQIVKKTSVSHKDQNDVELKNSKSLRKVSGQSAGGTRSRTTSMSQSEDGGFDRKQPERSSKTKPQWKY